MAVEVKPEISCGGEPYTDSGVRAVRAVAEADASKNQWSLYFPRSLVYPDGVSREAVEKLGHMALLKLAGVLKQRKTFEVTSEILSEVKTAPEDNLPS